MWKTSKPPNSLWFVIHHFTNNDMILLLGFIHKSFLTHNGNTTGDIQKCLSSAPCLTVSDP